MVRVKMSSAFRPWASRVNPFANAPAAAAAAPSSSSTSGLAPERPPPQPPLWPLAGGKRGVCRTAGGNTGSFEELWNVGEFTCQVRGPPALLGSRVALTYS